MDTQLMLETALREQFRANELKTALTNIAHAKEEHFQSHIADAYRDCCERLEKEFSLALPFDNAFEKYINQKKNKITDIVCPAEKYRGTKEYPQKLREAGKVADVLESLCYEMFQLGYDSAHVEKSMFIKKAVEWMKEWDFQEYPGAPVKQYIDDDMIEDFKRKM